MTIRDALVAGTVLSLAVTAVWSWTATLTTGPSPLPRMTGNLPGDYAQLAGAATGSSPWALFAVTAAIYALCFLASGLRSRRRVLREAARELDQADEAGPVLASGRLA
jgi:hypothetical protein